MLFSNRLNTGNKCNIFINTISQIDILLYNNYHFQTEFYHFSCVQLEVKEFAIDLLLKQFHLPSLGFNFFLQDSCVKNNFSFRRTSFDKRFHKVFWFSFVRLVVPFVSTIESWRSFWKNLKGYYYTIHNSSSWKVSRMPCSLVKP